ncbi:hypothetical protein JCM14719A_10350 [Calditerricola satsumensis]|uniref:Spore coat associated protein CotJA n=2 Tax=Calditerricola satsumensis TaxID=373054 RepID=A0A8J3B6S5_9BACI|nr:hypothetical protein GCM10007043_04260 [Calditerricola satsumensis]
MWKHPYPPYMGPIAPPMRHTNFKTWRPYASPFDPCPAERVKAYNTPPNLYLGFQPPNLPQYPPREALRRGTLWPALFSPYEGYNRPVEREGESCDGPSSH